MTENRKGKANKKDVKLRYKEKGEGEGKIGLQLPPGIFVATGPEDHAAALVDSVQTIFSLTKENFS